MENPEKPNVNFRMGLIGAILVGFLFGLIRIAVGETKLPFNGISLFFVDLPLWLALGVLFRKLTGNVNSSEYSSNKKSSIDNSTIIKGAVLSWFILGLVWLFSIWLPRLKFGDYGIELNMQSAPLVLWAGVAFLMAYHGAVTWKIPKAVVNQIRKLFRFEDEDMKGNAKFRWDTLLKGLAGLLGKGE